MSFLSNQELRELLASTKPPVRYLPTDDSGNLVQSSLEASSIKLRVGKIYRIEKTGKDGEVFCDNKNDVILEQGDVVFVLTMEEMDFPADIGALIFAKSGGVADRGILITNTGHVDPGYKGHLRYALINMGREKFSLRSGDVFVKLLLFRMSERSNPAWFENNFSIPDPNFDTLRSLGGQFGGFDERAERISDRVARDIFRKFGFYSLLGSFGFALIGILLTILIASRAIVTSEISVLEKRIIEIEKRVN